MFTDGKDRFYENLMQQTPYNKPKHSGKRQSKFRYRYVDLACDYCINRKTCKHDICPFIMDNLADLMEDGVFIHAVKNAEASDNKHKQTLLTLKENTDGR